MLNDYRIKDGHFVRLETLQSARSAKTLTFGGNYEIHLPWIL